MASTSTLNPNAAPFYPFFVRNANANEQPEDRQSRTSPGLLSAMPCALQGDEFYRVENTVPPIIVKPNSLPSLGFAQALIEALNKVPSRLRQAVSDWGYEIVTAPTMPEVLPEQPLQVNFHHCTNLLISTPLYTRVKQILKNKNWWQACFSNHPVFPKTITMPEQGWAPEGFVHAGNQMVEVNPEKMGHPPAVMVETFGYVPVKPLRVEGIMLHEFGHAVDDYLGKSHCKWGDGQARLLSMSDAFSNAYEADIKLLTNEKVRRYFAYYLPREDNPLDQGGEARAEAFAELFARLQMTEGDPQEQAFYRNSFPNVSHFIEKHVLRHWRRDDASVAQTPG